MATPYTLTLQPSAQAIPINELYREGNKWEIADVGTTTTVIGRVYPIGRSTGTTGRKLTLVHLIRPNGGAIQDYDDVHTEMEAITGYFDDPATPIAYGVLTGSDGLSINVRILKVSFEEPHRPAVPEGIVRFECEQVSN